MTVITTQRQKSLKLIQQLRLMDDDFLRLYFNNFPEGVKFILDIILERNDLNIIQSQTQSEYKSIAGRSISLDIYAEDNEGKKYNIEIQRSDSGATPKRARFHSSMIDTKLLKKNEKFDNLAETYVIFITENDVIGKGLPLYHFDRYCKETGDYMNDEAHIIYVNGAYQNVDDSIGRLMHDFQCIDADDMYNNELAERFRYFKEKQGGKDNMCRLVEEYAEAYAEEQINLQRKKDIERMLNQGILTHEQIAVSLDVSIDFVKNIADNREIAN